MKRQINIVRNIKNLDKASGNVDQTKNDTYSESSREEACSRKENRDKQFKLRVVSIEIKSDPYKER